MATSPRRISRVLIVDDHADTRELAEEIFGAEGFVVTTAADGPGALDAIRKECPDALLTDLTLPSMTGEALAAVVRGESGSAGILIVAMSGREVAAGQAHLFDKVACKPIDLIALAAELRAM